jgi:peptidoglycan/xylan/chitin deacetylase (PgdA/CDA1 family)
MKIKKFFKIFLPIYLMLCYTLSNYTYTVKASDSSTINNIQKVIYLTFDDGPSKVITNRTLDILKQENVKATFFVVGCKIQGREEVIKRIYNEGHTIGLHTYSHIYKKIYASDANFIEELDKTSMEIKKVIGIEPRLIRFPSGSKKHLSSNLLEKLHEKNYKIYDWNLTLSDGIDYHTPANKLFNEATSKCINPNKIFLLMHCDEVNETTCEVLGKIIQYYKDKGYVFKTITSETPEYHFRVSK